MATGSSIQSETRVLEENTIDIAHYLNVIKRFFWRILGLALFLTLLVALLVLSATPQYKTKVSLLIDAEEARITSIEEVYGLDSNRKEYFQTQYEILRSRQIAEKVVLRMSLHTNSYFDSDVVKEQQSSFSKTMMELKENIRESFPFLPQTDNLALSAEQLEQSKIGFAVGRLLKSVTVSPLDNTQVVELFVETPSAALSAEIANSYAEVYIENYLDAKFEMTEKATSWLNESLQGLRDKLDRAERDLAEFFEVNQVVNVDGIVGLTTDQVQQLSDQLLEAQIRLQQEQAIFEQISLSNGAISKLASLPEVLNHPSIQIVKNNEVNAQSKVFELSKIYGPKHPKMISANAELESIQASLSIQVNNLVTGINAEFENTKDEVESLSSDLEKAKSELRRLSALDNKRRALQRDVDINQQLYDSFFTRLKETDQIGGFESANARVLDSALVPKVPSKPKKGLIIFAAFVMSFGFGAVLALVLEALNSGIRSVDDVERKLSQRMLGIIPWEPHKKKENLSVRHYFDPSHHLFSESVRTIRTSLQLLNIDKPSQTILVTSSVPKEGKSTVSVNLAFALGQLSRVILVDTDLRRPSIGKLFALPGFQPGLANVVAGTHSLEECIVKDEESNLDVLSAGTLPPNPQELLASEKFAALIEHLKRKYDYIVVDSAPTQAVSDAIVVSKYCDSLIYVVKADSTNEKIINNGLSRFIEIGHRIDGVVLNQVDIKKAKRSGEYSGFYDQYGYNSYTQKEVNN